MSQDAAERGKREQAVLILGRADDAVSVQVMQEFYVQAIRAKGSAKISHDAARAIASGLRRFPVQPMTLAILAAARALARRVSRGR